MNDFEHKWHREVKQKRADDAIKSIGEAARVLAQDGRLDLLTTRNVAEFSGYSVGTMYHYFERFEDIFIDLFLKRRARAITQLNSLIDTHASTEHLNVLISVIVTKSIGELSRPHPKVLQWILHQFFKRANEPEKLNSIIDLMVQPLIAAAKRDQTGSFRQLTDQQLKLILRAIQAMIRSPFFENDPIAGSQDHIQFVTNESCRLLVKLST